MSFDALLNRQLTVKRMAPSGSVDDWGNPVAGEVTIASGVPGALQQRTAREMALASQAGIDIGDWVGFMRPLAGIDSGCWIEDEGSQRYDIVGTPVDAGGRGHHLELGLRRVG